MERLIQAFSRLIRDIQGCWCIFSHIYRHPTREEAKPPLLYFLKFEKDALILEKKGLDCVHLWVKFSIQNVVSRVGEKTLKCFPAGLLFLVFLKKSILNSTSSTNLSHPLPWKMSGCAPAIGHYSFCKTLHLKYLTFFFNTPFSWYLLSNFYSELMLLMLQWANFYIQNSNIFRHIQAYLNIKA